MECSFVALRYVSPVNRSNDQQLATAPPMTTTPLSELHSYRRRKSLFKG